MCSVLILSSDAVTHCRTSILNSHWWEMCSAKGGKRKIEKNSYHPPDVTDVEAPEADAAFDGPKRGTPAGGAADHKWLQVTWHYFSSFRLWRGKDKMLSSSTASGGMFKLLNPKIKDQGTTLLLNLVAYFTVYSGPTMMAVIPLKWVFEEFSDSLSLQCYTSETLFLSGCIVQCASCHSDQNEILKSKLNMCNSVF